VAGGASEHQVGLVPGLSSPPGFTEWVRPHWTSMSRLAVRLAGGGGEDVLQEALMLAWRKRDRFDPSKGSARNWLLALTADSARKYRRRDRTKAPSVLDLEPTYRDIDQHIDVDHAMADARLKLRPFLEGSRP
jgi:RNA polymerase sigma-70 factor (ECF subfamily)